MNNNLKNTLLNLKKSWKYIKNQKKKVFICIFLSLLLCIVSVVTPLLSAQMLLKITSGLFEQLLVLAIIVTIIEISRNIFNFLYQKVISLYLLETVSGLQYEVAKETLTLETKELDKKSSGVFIDRLNNDTREIVNIFTDLGDALIDVMSNIGILISILFINFYMFLFLTITSIFLFILEKKRMKKVFEIDMERRKISEKNTGLISELVRGIRDIKVLNIGENFLNKTKDKLIESNQENYKMRKVNFNYSLWIATAKDIFRLLFLLLGIILCYYQQMSIASFVIVYMYYDRIINLLRYFTYMIELTKKFNVASNRVFEIIDEGHFEKEKFGLKEIEKVNGDFEFKNVTFSYNEENIILRDISFSVKANQTVAFVGKSGGGKSTIFSLIDHLYTIDNGNIYIDHIDINELTKDSIRNNISIITQNPYIFNFSIRDNLKLVKEDMKEEEMIDVCKLAYLHDFIITLKDGYDTIVGEGGVSLSGGQRQRLAIARALLKKTEIILFDEATSALDNETQNNIQKAIHSMRGEYTILIIAHRLSTVIDCDKIFLVDSGTIVDSGTHQELIKNNEEYKHLYEKELS